MTSNRTIHTPSDALSDRLREASRCETTRGQKQENNIETLSLSRRGSSVASANRAMVGRTCLSAAGPAPIGPTKPLIPALFAGNRAPVACPAKRDPQDLSGKEIETAGRLEKDSKTPANLFESGHCFTRSAGSGHKALAAWTQVD